MSYEFYKIVHLSGLFLMLMSLGAIFYQSKPQKSLSVLFGFSTLLVITGGMGLLKNIGLSMKNFSSLPLWVHFKLYAWLLIGFLGSLLAKRLKVFRKLTLSLFVVLCLFSVYLVVFRVSTFSEMF